MHLLLLLAAASLAHCCCCGFFWIFILKGSGVRLDPHPRNEVSVGVGGWGREEAGHICEKDCVLWV
jgi:hypothetical protein